MNESHTLESALAAIRQWEPDVQALVDWAGSPLRPAVGAAKAGALTGWSVAVKDIIDVAGVPTLCNAPFVPASPAAENAAIVDQLESCGARIVAKSVTTSFAYYDPGPTRNPWNLDHTPGGSSSGSAAAVSCGMVRLALGSQTVGSINRPASFCGVVGFKPTYGALPVEGVFPFAPSVDTVGFFTGNATDAQSAFAALSGTPAAVASGELRFGVVEDLLCAGANPDMLEAVRNTAEKVRTEGPAAERISLPESLRPAHDYHSKLTAAEAAESHRQLFAQYGAQYPPKLRQLIELGQSVTAEALREVEEHRSMARTLLEQQFDQWDVLISPSAPGQATPGLDSTGDPRMNLLWTYVGFPTLTVPAGLGPDGLPLGVQLTGAPGSDARLLAAGVHAERVIEFGHTPG